MLIYKATINRKSYVGLFTGETNKFNKRKREHKRDALFKRDNCYFHNAIRKHGVNIKWEILEDNLNDINILNEREQYYIKKHKTFKPNGYNLTRGGDGIIGYKHTPKTKKKISESRLGPKHPFYGKHLSKEIRYKMGLSHKGKKFTQEHKDKISKAMKGKQNCLGRKLSEETKRKIGLSGKGKHFHVQSKTTH